MKRLKKRERRKKRRVKEKACKPDSFVSPPNDLKSICFSLTASLLRPPSRWGHPPSSHAPSPPPPCPSTARGREHARLRALGHMIGPYRGFSFFILTLFYSGDWCLAGVVLLTPFYPIMPSVFLLLTHMPPPETVDNT